MKTKKLAGILSAAVLASSCTSAIACQTASAKELSSASIAYDINTPAADVTGTAYAKTAEGFVQRMYNVALNRNADAAGLNNWTSQLKSGKKTAADLIDGFFFSDEYKGKKKSADEMIADCYNAMLDRSPDATGKANWKLRFNVGMSMQAICKGFVGSNEFKGLCKTYGIKPGTINLRLAKDENYERTYFVYRLYKNCLERTPDISGLESWCKKLKNGTTGSQIAYGFVFGKEYMERLNAKTGEPFLNNYVRILYNALLGRNPDTVGKEKWKNKLREPNSLQYVFNGLLMSSEFKEQCEKAGIKVGRKIADPGDVDFDTIVKEIIEKINRKRAEKGIAPLKVHPVAVKAADAYMKNKFEGGDELNYKKVVTDCGITDKNARCQPWMVIFTPYKYLDLSQEGEKFRFASSQAVIDDLWNWSQSRNYCLEENFKYIGITTGVQPTQSETATLARYSIIFVG